MEVHNGSFIKYEITPEQFGFNRAQKLDVMGGTPQENAQITLDILNGKSGAQRDVILLNSALAIHTARPTITIGDAIDLARKVINDGTALNKLDELIRLTENGVAA